MKRILPILAALCCMAAGVVGCNKGNQEEKEAGITGVWELSSIVLTATRSDGTMMVIQSAQDYYDLLVEALPSLALFLPNPADNPQAYENFLPSSRLFEEEGTPRFELTEDGSCKYLSKTAHGEWEADDEQLHYVYDDGQLILTLPEDEEEEAVSMTATVTKLTATEAQLQLLFSDMADLVYNGDEDEMEKLILESLINHFKLGYQLTFKRIA